MIKLLQWYARTGAQIARSLLRRPTPTPVADRLAEVGERCLVRNEGQRTITIRIEGEDFRTPVMGGVTTDDGKCRLARLQRPLP